MEREHGLVQAAGICHVAVLMPMQKPLRKRGDKRGIIRKPTASSLSIRLFSRVASDYHLSPRHTLCVPNIVIVMRKMITRL